MVELETKKKNEEKWKTLLEDSNKRKKVNNWKLVQYKKWQSSEIQMCGIKFS